MDDVEVEIFRYRQSQLLAPIRMTDVSHDAASLVNSALDLILGSQGNEVKSVSLISSSPHGPKKPVFVTRPYKPLSWKRLGMYL